MNNNEPKKSIHERVQEFIARPDYPQALRRNAAIAYHPDKAVGKLEKKIYHEIMVHINNTCDKLEGK